MDIWRHFIRHIVKYIKIIFIFIKPPSIVG